MEFSKLHKPKNMPNTVVIILGIIICAVFLTWIVPAGSYTRIVNADGIKVIDPTKFSFTAAHPVSLAAIPAHIVKGFESSIAIFLVILFSGGAFQYINSSGALQSVVAKMVRKYASKIWIFIPVLSLIFTLIATSQAVNTFIPFAPIFVMIAKAMKLDSIVGVGIILLGGAVGFSTGTLNTSTTMVAQEIAGLPLFSGIGYRTFCLVIFSIVTNIYLIKYATKISKNPESSYMYDLDQASGEKYDLETLENFGPMTIKKWSVLGVLIITLGFMVYGCLFWKWGMEQLAACYLWMALGMAIVLRLTPNKAVEEFVTGAKKMLMAGIIICSARAIASILNDGHIIDTIIFYLAIALNVIPHFLLGPAMYIINIIVNFFITSGSGQAVVVIPIIAPLADMIGMTRQTAILSFNFGDGFCNYILPTSSALMGILSMGNVPYDRWMKFMWKLFLIWVAVGSVLMIGAQLIQLGPK